MSEAGKSMMAAFQATPESSGRARAFSSRALTNFGCSSQMVDLVTLVVSELVTNAVLHAHSGPTVTLHVNDNRIRLEVEDASDAFPLLRDLGRDATTGRGIALVKQASTTWGVESTNAGKRVWAEFDQATVVQIPQYEEHEAAEILAAVAGEHNVVVSQPGTEGETKEVQFLQIPVKLYVALEQHHESLMRELQLLVLDAQDPQQVARQLDPSVAALVELVRPMLEGNLGELRLAIRRAGETGVGTINLQATCTPAMYEWAMSFGALMDEAERLSAAGLLLTPPPEPAVLALREWLRAELRRQLEHQMAPAQSPILTPVTST